MLLTLFIILFTAVTTGLAVFATNKSEKSQHEKHVLTRHGQSALAIIAINCVLQLLVAIVNKASEANKEATALEKEKALTVQNGQFRKDTASLSEKLSNANKEVDALHNSIGDADKANTDLRILLGNTQSALDKMMASAEALQKEVVPEVVSTDKFGTRIGNTSYVKAELDHEYAINLDAKFKKGSDQLFCVLTSKFQLAEGTKSIEVRLINVKSTDCKLLKFQLCADSYWSGLWAKSDVFESGDKQIKVEMDKVEDTYLSIPFDELKVARRIIQQNPGAGFAIVETK